MILQNISQIKRCDFNKLINHLIKSLIIIVIFTKVIHAQSLDAPVDRGVGFYFDQDLLIPFGYNEDRDYTMGLAFEFFWEKDKGIYPLDRLVKVAGEWMGIEDSSDDYYHSFMLGMLAYTPDDLADSSPIFDDRPYSSLIYLSNKRVRADSRNAVAAEVLIGVLGTNIAESAQTRLHTAYRSVSDDDEPVDPMGWSYQISDGGELTMRLRVTNSRLKESLSNKGNYDVATTWGASLGFQTNINLGVALRAGSIKSPFWSLPFDPVTRGNFMPSRSKNEWYVWSAIRTHLIAYDALLQGQFKHSDVTYTGDDIERFVYDGGIGLTLGFEDSQVTISTNAKTSDLKVMDRKQIWGSIIYVINF